MNLKQLPNLGYYIFFFVILFLFFTMILLGIIGFILEGSKDYVSLVFFILLASPFLTLVYLIKKWYLVGKDPAGTTIIVPEIEVPEKFLPAEVAAIFYEDIDLKALNAEIINLAAKGYLKFKYLPEMDDFLFIKLKNTKDLNKFENKLFNIIFDKDVTKQQLSMIRERIMVQIFMLGNDILDSMTDNGYFQKNPNAIRSKYFAIGAVLLFLAFVLFNVVPETSSFFYIFGGIALALLINSGIVLFFSYRMPKRTKKGVLALEKIKGFKHYLEVAEIDKLKFHFGNETLPEIYNHLLPYALVLGVKLKWASHFAKHLEGQEIDRTTIISNLPTLADDVIKYQRDYYQR